MDALTSSLSPRKSRLGFHYYPDTLHYRESDLAAWLPEFQALGVSWLVLQSDAARAIPESFLSGLVHAGIEPIIQFNLSLGNPPEPAEMQAILEAYAHWGARAVLFFDRPNARSSWPSSGWAQQDLVERFLDRFLPLATSALKLGLSPLFPALEPGGNYWDTAFLWAALQSLDRRKQTSLLQNLVLTAHAWTGGHSLNWGAGGPESWPETRPYITPKSSEDQRGFRIYDWYQTVSLAVLNRPLPVILLSAGIPSDPARLPVQNQSPQQHRDTALSIVRLLAGDPVADPEKNETLLDPIPQNVLACNFWLLTDIPGSPHYDQAWYRAGEDRLPAVQSVKEWLSQPRQASEPKTAVEEMSNSTGQHPLRHYLLLPAYEWGVADWHLDVIRPFVKKYTPTVGFSIKEASFASRVTVVGSQQSFPEEQLQKLRLAGCSVERISGDGTSIATQLAER